MTVPTSPSLLLRIRDPNDQAAWEEFLSIYSVIVRDYCYRRHLQSADVDDVIQDVMASVSTAIKRFEYDPTKGRFRAWLGTIAANCIKTRMSQAAKESVQTVFAGNMNLNETSSDPDSDWISVFSEHIFRTACSRIRKDFADKTWECFNASWIRNEIAGDIAERLNIPVHSVYVNKSRVLKRLETEVKTLAEDLPFASLGNFRHD
jgi:RNA polymerase sigma factor (sigma-70 family)